MKNRHHTLGIAFISATFLSLSPLGMAEPSAEAGRDADTKAAEAGERAPDQRTTRPGRMGRGMRGIAESERAGKMEKAEKMKARMMAAREKQAWKASDKPRKDAKRGPMPPQAKIRHLRMAAEQLKAAGYEEGAQKAMAEARRLEMEMRSPAEERMEGDRAMNPAEAVRGEIMRLRRDLEEIRREVQRLKQKDAGPGRSSPESRRPGSGRPKP